MHLEIPPLVSIGRLVSLEARARLERGDLAGSWNDIIVLFRTARHLTEGSGIQPALSSLQFNERDALNLAVDWAMARCQTPERLHAALAAYHNLPKMPNPSEIVRAEANIVENTLDVAVSTFRDWLTQSLFEGTQAQGAALDYTFASTNLTTAPWERARMRRLNRFYSAELLEIASRPPGQPPDQTVPEINNRALGYALRSTPRPMMNLIGNIGPYIDNDFRHEVGRRALAQILPLRSWQLRHGGRLPDDLGALVPEEIPNLPKDPYSNQPFRYVVCNDQKILNLRSFLEPTPNFREFLRGPAPPGSRLVFSIGRFYHNDNAGASTKTDAIETFGVGVLIPTIDANAPPRRTIQLWRLPRIAPEPTAPE